jgi:hypothetical protein
MALNDQPSILTVCVPGSASDRHAPEIAEFLAARQEQSLRAAAAVAGTDPTKSFGGSSEKCDPCDDSACGIDGLAGKSGRTTDCLTQRLAGSESAGFGEQLDSRTGGALEEVTAAASELCQPSFFHADSGKKAMELLRMLRFDLLVTGDRLPDMPVSQFIRRVRIAWPWQKWAMVGSVITTQDEIAARTLGAIAVFDAPPDWEALGSLAAIAASRGGNGGGKSAAASPESGANADRHGSDGRSMELAAELAAAGASVRKAARPASRRSAS